LSTITRSTELAKLLF